MALSELKKRDSSSISSALHPLHTPRMEEDIQEDLPLTLLIPLTDSNDCILRSLESLKAQKQKPKEVIILNGGVDDRVIRAVKEFNPLITRIYPTPTNLVSDLLNRGVLLAENPYTMILFPGSVYLSVYALQDLYHQAYTNPQADLIYTGVLLRKKGGDIKYQQPFSKELLKKGEQPTFLEACLFKTSLFERVDKFKSFKEALDFDFFCSLSEMGMHYISLKRIYLEVERLYHKKKTHAAFEMAVILTRHFGLKWGIRSLLLRSALNRVL